MTPIGQTSQASRTGQRQWARLALLCRLMLLAVLLGATTAAPAQAADDADARLIEQGRASFDTCRGCHAIAGYRNAYPNYAVPRLAGQNADYIEAALADYRHGARDNAVMQAQARSLSDAQIHAIAVYLSQAGGTPSRLDQ